VGMRKWEKKEGGKVRRWKVEKKEGEKMRG
jgi:hypothetical protein